MRAPKVVNMPQEPERADSPDLSVPVSVADAIEITGLNERTIRRYVKRGKIRARREKRRLWLERADVEALIGPAVDTGQAGGRSGHARSGGSGGLMGVLQELQEEKRGIMAEMVRERREHSNEVKELRLLTTGHDNELVSWRDRAVRAETSRRWALILAVVLGAGVVALAVALVVNGAP